MGRPGGASGGSEGVPQFEELPPIDREVLARIGLDLGDDLIETNYAVMSALLTDCMAQRGFEFDRGPRPESLDPIGHRDWHPLDREYAELYGYQGAPRPPSEMNDRANADLQFADALFGSEGAPGCFGLVARFVDEETGYESVGDEISLLRDEPLVAMGAWATTDEYRRLIGEWSACMNERGYSFASLDDARSVAGDGGHPSDGEVATRLADIDCDIAVGLTAARSAYETQIAAQWADENAEAVNEMRTKISTVASRLIDLQQSDPTWNG